MDRLGKKERYTQNRVIKLFREELNYDWLGSLHDKDNRNVEDDLLIKYLKQCGDYDDTTILRATQLLQNKATYTETLYDTNREIYELLRYGVPVPFEDGRNEERVQCINWQEPEKNHFAIAEEVTVLGNQEKRPDIVLYVNGIAIAVLELKNSRVSIGDGIRQSIVNQSREFIQSFFSTVQFVFAGNDSEGLRYGSIGTPEKYFLQWKEDETDNSRYKLDKYLIKMCSKDRLIDLMRDFVLFDGGVKKLPRVHQYFGIKAAQEFAERKESGIIWHTQGSGKSIVMVFLAKWILEHNPNARVVVITDRDELDKQIEGVFQGAGETIERAGSGLDLMSKLGQARPRLLCSLIHKFGKRGVDNFEQFIKDIKSQPCHAVGEVFVFVDECHRTQKERGKLHRTMKAILSNAVFIGFTGTPLLKKDRAITMELFGRYIHTYKYNEAVEDNVVLDLVYEARDIDQHLESEEEVDEWFEIKTKNLNDWQKAALREQWGTAQKVLSSQSRMDRMVRDIVRDFTVKPRLSSERGNAILVAGSIYEACRYYELFQNTQFRNKCAVVTSYTPKKQDITTEDIGENTETAKEYICNVYNKLLEEEKSRAKKATTESYEDRVKGLFKTQPANMKLLIVVDKLLTGFDAPSCTYLYIDKSMQDHGLFQAICRVNRLDGDDKLFGCIVDYKDLFKKVEKAIAVYTSELDLGDRKDQDPDILLYDRLTKAREKLDHALEVIAFLCEPVAPPQGELEYIHYFCGNTEIPTELKEKEPQRAALYKAIAVLVRAYSNISDELEAAGYTSAEIKGIKEAVDRYLKLRELIRRASGETIDLKSYEADMRYLIDSYIDADRPRTISPFGDMTLLEIIHKTGIEEAIDNMPEGVKQNEEAVAETIENNVRSKIIKDHLNDPAFYRKMSKLLEEIIIARKQKALEYEEYLQQIAELANQVETGNADDTPEVINTPALRSLYHNLFTGGNVHDSANSVHETRQSYGNETEESDPGSEVSEERKIKLVLAIDEAVRRVRSDDWRGNINKERMVKNALYEVLNNEQEVERVFPIIVQQEEY